jgi:hypothetical protein
MMLRVHCRERTMCRSIHTLANFEPPATDAEIRAAAVQFVRKLSGASRPSQANQLVFERAVDEVTTAATRLIHDLKSSGPHRNREAEARKAQERARERYTRPSFTSPG